MTTCRTTYLIVRASNINIIVRRFFFAAGRALSTIALVAVLVTYWTVGMVGAFIIVNDDSCWITRLMLLTLNIDIGILNRLSYLQLTIAIAIAIATAATIIINTIQR
jgi:hypothetical protein